MADSGLLVGLRCPYCGASLSEVETALVTCKFCGTTVRVEDATNYVEHLKGFIVDWMRTALPFGIGSMGSASVDPLARHNIFVQNILPSLNAEFGRIQLNAFEAFTSPLIAPPFVQYSFVCGRQKDAKPLFLYNAKIASVQPLAANAEDQAVAEKMGGLSRAYAHVLIGLDLMEKSQVLPYKIAAENFSVASKAVEAQYEVLGKRLMGLSETYLSIDSLLSVKLTDVRARVQRGKIMLEEALAKSAVDINLSIWGSAIEQELEVAKTVLLLADLLESDTTGDQLGSLKKVESFFKKAAASCQVSDSRWKNSFENLGRYNEIARWLLLAFEAKKGRKPIKIVSGPGDVLFPFWVAEVNYTFGTGALWMRKGKYVKETALVAATFPAYPNFACSPSEVVTDIFSRRPDGSIIGSITGSEASISTGESLGRMVKNATLRTVSGYKIVPPLSTGTEAKQLMNEYLRQVYRGQEGKLQVASCEVTDLIFVPGDLSTGFINFYGTLGWVQPRRVGDLQLVNSIAI
jgi:hypothetical protein